MFGKLAERESEIVELVAQGLCNKSIASRLDISDNTVRHRTTSVFGKLGVHGRLALAVCAFRNRNL
jgi:DNA-binding NarL/FixJ family response regulator